MIDAMRRKPLRVLTDGTAGPYIMVPFDQLAEVRQVLDKHHVSYSVEEDVISLDGSPETAVIDLGLEANVESVQAVLDSVR
jgi:hypothetical protein